MGNTNYVHIERPDSGPIRVNSTGFLLSPFRFVTIDKVLKVPDPMKKLREKSLLFTEK